MVLFLANKLVGLSTNFIFFVEATPWDDINFRFYFCNEVVYPPGHDFIFLVFGYLKIFFINIFMNPFKTQTNFLYT